MSPSLSGLIGAARRFATRAIDVLVREIAGRDYFISYARRDAAAYAARLAKRLGEQHSVYLDQLDIPRGAELPPRLRRALRRASMLVLVGSREAAKSASIRDELKLFVATQRPALLVDIDMALDEAPWRDPPWSELSGVYRQPESRAASDAAEVSPEVLAYIRDSFTYTRQDRRLSRATWLAVGFIVAAVVSAGWFWIVANNARAAATAAERNANAARKEEAQAKEETASALRQTGELMTVANDAKARAAIADANAARARKQEAAALANAALQQRIATSRRLAGESSARRSSQPNLGMLLAAHALDAYPTAEARRALFDAVARSPAVAAIVRDAHDTGIYRAAVSPDAWSIATRDRHGGTVLWDVKTRRHVSLMAPLLAKGHGSNLGALAFSPSGDLLAVSQKGIGPAGPVEVWSAREARRIAPLRTTGDLMAFVSESTLAVESGSGFFRKSSVAFWDVSDPSSPFELPARLEASGGFVALVADPARGLLVLQDGAGLMVCRAPCDKGDRLPYDSSEGGMVPGIALSLGDRSLVAAMSEDNLVNVWLADQPQREAIVTIRPQLPPPSDDVTKASLAFSADGERLAIARADGIVVLDLFSRPDDEPIRQRVIPYGPDITAMAFAANGLLAVAQADGAVAFVDTERIVAPARMYAHPSDLRSARFGSYGLSGDDTRLLIARDRQLALWTPGADPAPRQLPDVFKGEIWAVAIGQDGQAIAAAGAERARSRESTVIVWDGDGHERSRPLLSIDGATRDLKFLGSSRNRMLAILLETGSLSVYDLKDLGNPHMLFAATLQPPSIWQHAFDRSGRRLAATLLDRTNRLDGIVRLWDRGRHPVDMLKPPGELRALAFTPDGRTLVGFLEDDLPGSILKWDLSRPSAPPTQTVLYTERERSSASAAMSSDAALLAFVNDMQIVLWDVEQGLPLGTLPLARQTDTIAFSPDGTRILAFDYEALTIVDIGSERLAIHACSIAARKLTEDERNNSSSNVPYRPYASPEQATRADDEVRRFYDRGLLTHFSLSQ